MEKWLDIPEYNGYQVSDKGRIRTKNKQTHTTKHGIRKWQDRILKQKKSTNKYGRQDYRVDLWKNGEHKTFLVARLVAFTFLNEDIKNTQLTVNHKDKNSLNNNLENLELITLKENIQHEFRLGISSQIKVKVENKLTGAIIYPSSLAEGSKMIGKNPGYLSSKLKKKVFEDSTYRWELA